jgi:predicted nucleic acid-binding protein
LAELKLLAIKSTPTIDLMEDALVLANEKNLTAYDACYAVLAKRMEIPLITADEPVVKVIDWAVWLGDIKT